jgi:hypothetical protein
MMRFIISLACKYNKKEVGALPYKTTKPKKILNLRPTCRKAGIPSYIDYLCKNATFIKKKYQNTYAGRAPGVFCNIRRKEIQGETGMGMAVAETRPQF